MKCRMENPQILDNYVRNLLSFRGVEDIEGFLNPNKNNLQDPDDLVNINEGAQLYLSNIGDDKRILIIVDSDCDGFTSSAIIYQYTKIIAPTTQIDYWLHNGKEHGLSDHIDKLMDEEIKYDLIILPDSSSNDVEYHNKLKEINTPCLCLDHHQVDVTISDNAIIVNNQISPNYRNKELVGAGVTFQFCRYIDKLLKINRAEDFIDLAALGQIGDMGSVLTLENRYIISRGLKSIKNFMFKSMIEKQDYSMGGKITPISVAFYIVPLINAMIRVGTNEEKDRLFRSFIDGEELVVSHKRGAKGELEKVAIESIRECTNAKSRQTKLIENAEQQIEYKICKYGLLNNKVILVRLEDDMVFPSELNGLLAMKIAAKYKRPAMVLRLGPDGYDKGSMRGVNQSALTSFKDFLNESGFVESMGHDNAAGAIIKDENLSAFHAYANKKLANIDFGENYYDINFERNVTSPDLDRLITDISRHDDIWGQSNNVPLIHVKGLIVEPNEISIIGKNSDTVKIEKNGITYIKFKAKDMIEDLSKYSETINIEIVGEANLNEWGGRTTPQIFIKDYEIKKENIFEF